MKSMRITRHISRLALVFAAFLIALVFDAEILHAIITHRIPALNTFLIWISYAGSIIVVLFVMTSLFLWESRDRKKIPLLWLALGLASLITSLLKILIARPRPIVEALVAFDTFSFPSGHATAVFSALPFLIKEFPKFRWFWLAFSLLVIYSRIYLGAHYLSDVIAGSIIGYAVGIFLLWTEERTHFLGRILLRLRAK